MNWNDNIDVIVINIVDYVSIYIQYKIKQDESTMTQQ